MISIGETYWYAIVEILVQIIKLSTKTTDSDDGKTVELFHIF